MHDVLTPNPTQVQVHNTPNQAPDLQDSAHGAGSCEVTVEDQHSVERVRCQRHVRGHMPRFVENDRRGGPPMKGAGSEG